jgi:hypothetical protein
MISDECKMMNERIRTGLINTFGWLEAASILNQSRAASIYQTASIFLFRIQRSAFIISVLTPDFT